MVVGNGMIATRFNDYKNDDGFIIFASGVSNSSLQNDNAFLREKNLLNKTSEEYQDKLLVYFSTCSIYDVSLSQSSYVQHKLRMEDEVTKHAGGYLIFRVSNPVGKTGNKHTLLNFFIDAITHHKQFTIYRGAERNLIDLDDMFAACNYILKTEPRDRSILNIANPNNYPVANIVHQLERYFSIQATVDVKEKDSVPIIDTTLAQTVFAKLDIVFDEGYLLHLLHKYYPLA